MRNPFAVVRQEYGSFRSFRQFFPGRLNALRQLVWLALGVLLVCGCSASSGVSSEQDAGPDSATCYPTNGNIRLACEWACGLNLREYQRSGGADAGLYFDYTQCLNECGCDQWPDGGDGQ